MAEKTELSFLIGAGRVEVVSDDDEEDTGRVARYNSFDSQAAASVEAAPVPRRAASTRGAAPAAPAAPAAYLRTKYATRYSDPARCSTPAAVAIQASQLEERDMARRNANAFPMPYSRQLRPAPRDRRPAQGAVQPPASSAKALAALRLRFPTYPTASLQRALSYTGGSVALATRCVLGVEAEEAGEQQLQHQDAHVAEVGVPPRANRIGFEREPALASGLELQARSLSPERRVTTRRVRHERVSRRASPERGSARGFSFRTVDPRAGCVSPERPGRVSPVRDRFGGRISPERQTLAVPVATAELPPVNSSPGRSSLPTLQTSPDQPIALSSVSSPTGVDENSRAVEEVSSADTGIIGQQMAEAAAADLANPARVSIGRSALRSLLTQGDWTQQADDISARSGQHPIRYVQTGPRRSPPPRSGPAVRAQNAKTERRGGNPAGRRPIQDVAEARASHRRWTLEKLESRNSGGEAKFSAWHGKAISGANTPAAVLHRSSSKLESWMLLRYLDETAGGMESPAASPEPQELRPIRGTPPKRQGVDNVARPLKVSHHSIDDAVQTLLYDRSKQAVVRRRTPSSLPPAVRRGKMLSSELARVRVEQQQADVRNSPNRSPAGTPPKRRSLSSMGLFGADPREAGRLTKSSLGYI